MKKKTLQKNGPIQQWGKKINWGKRVKSVCKPCWEIKYCPYGPLIESFPNKKESDDKSCRIFGHDCPVYYVAEPLTETKELRNISRTIPRSVQFKVLKRENQICSECGQATQDEDVEFDHIIPWSKGGCSDDHNVRLLCRPCNRKRGNRFEEKYLIESLGEHLSTPVPVDFVFAIHEITEALHYFISDNGHLPSAVEFCKLFGRRKVKEEDKMGVQLFEEIHSFFMSRRPKDIKAKDFKALQHRWGFTDGELHKLRDTAKLYDIEIDALLNAEIGFINRLGFQIKITDSDKKKWLRK